MALYTCINIFSKGKLCKQLSSLELAKNVCDFLMKFACEMCSLLSHKSPSNFNERMSNEQQKNQTNEQTNLLYLFIGCNPLEIIEVDADVVYLLF